MQFECTGRHALRHRLAVEVTKDFGYSAKQQAAVLRLRVHLGHFEFDWYWL